MSVSEFGSASAFCLKGCSAGFTSRRFARREAGEGLAPSCRAGDRTSHHGPSHLWMEESQTHRKGDGAGAFQLNSFTEHLHPSEQPASLKSSFPQSRGSSLG